MLKSLRHYINLRDPKVFCYASRGNHIFNLKALFKWMASRYVAAAIAWYSMDEQHIFLLVDKRVTRFFIWKINLSLVLETAADL